MHLRYLIFALAALVLGAGRPLHAEETVNGPVYIVTYFDVAPAAAQQSAAILRDLVQASRKEDGNAGFEAFEEIERPSRFAILETWRDKKNADAHAEGPAASTFKSKLQPLMIGGFGVRPHGGLSVGAPKGQVPPDAVYALTHVDVFPMHKDQAIELVKTRAEAARNDNGNLRYDVVQWDGHPNHFTLVEVWENSKAFEAHESAEHTKDFRAKLQPLLGSPFDERLHHTMN